MSATTIRLGTDEIELALRMWAASNGLNPVAARVVVDGAVVEAEIDLREVRPSRNDNWRLGDAIEFEQLALGRAGYVSTWVGGTICRLDPLTVSCASGKLHTLHRGVRRRRPEIEL